MVMGLLYLGSKLLNIWGKRREGTSLMIELLFEYGG